MASETCGAIGPNGAKCVFGVGHSMDYHYAGTVDVKWPVHREACPDCGGQIEGEPGHEGCTDCSWREGAEPEAEGGWHVWAHPNAGFGFEVRRKTGDEVETVANGIPLRSIAEKVVEALAADEREIGTVEELHEALKALEWYGEEVLTYAVTQATEPRSAAHADKGKKARAALPGLRRALARLRTAEHSEEVEAERCQQCGGEMVGASGHNLDGSDQDWYGCGSCGWDDLQPMVEAIARLRDGKLTLTIGVQTFVIHVPRNDAEEDFGVRLEWYKRQLDAALATLTGKGTE